MTAPDAEADGDESLREHARQRMQDMPAETVLGNRDPQGGGHGDPSDYQGNPEQQ